MTSYNRVQGPCFILDGYVVIFPIIRSNYGELKFNTWAYVERI